MSFYTSGVVIAFLVILLKEIFSPTLMADCINNLKSKAEMELGSEKVMAVYISAFVVSLIAIAFLSVIWPISMITLPEYYKSRNR
ncbi:MAG: hypothetical protein HY506_01695 [Candidatus Yanofskybacteria bacterium]|nr:hypothetical protein [Candidatus Yanofskybacteria bacterium]